MKLTSASLLPKSARQLLLRAKANQDASSSASTARPRRVCCRGRRIKQ